MRDIDVEMIIIALNYLPLVTTYRTCSLFTLSKSLTKHLNADSGQIHHNAAVDAQRRLRRRVLHIKCKSDIENGLGSVGRRRSLFSLSILEKRGRARARKSRQSRHGAQGVNPGPKVKV